MKSTKKLLYAGLACITLWTSCKKDDIQPANVSITTGVYVLNEGQWNQSNSKISAYDGTSSGTVVEDYYKKQNSKGLGDTGNDLKIYNGRMYCVVNGSGYVSVMNASDAKEIGSVSFKSNSARNIAFYGSKAYVCSFDGTVVQIDLGILAITATLTLGTVPEDLCVANGKLYVSNSSYAPVVGNTVSVIDLSSFSVVQTITVGANPGKITADNNGNLFVVLQGQYDLSYNTIPGSQPIKKIDTSGNVTTLTTLGDVLKYTLVNGKIYAYGTDKNIKVYDTASNQITQSNFITNMGGNTFVKINGLNFDSNTNRLYVCDAPSYTTTGFIYCFDSAGVFLYKKSVGVSPSKVVFLTN